MFLTSEVLSISVTYIYRIHESPSTYLRIALEHWKATEHVNGEREGVFCGSFELVDMQAKDERCAALEELKKINILNGMLSLRQITVINVETLQLNTCCSKPLKKCLGLKEQSITSYREKIGKHVCNIISTKLINN